MSSLFLRSTRSLVKELGRKGELVPVDSLSSSPRLRPFCLVRKKNKSYLWPWDTSFIPTDFTLLDILEPGCPDLDVKHSGPINAWEKTTGARTGAVGLSPGMKGQVTGSSENSCHSAVTVQTLWVTPCTWEMLLAKRKLRSPRPSFLQELQCRKDKESLYVVTEVVVTLQDTVLQSHSQTLRAGQLALPQPSHAQVQGQSHVGREKILSIPQGSVLAYRVLRLVVEKDGWGGVSSKEPEECNFLDLQDQAESQLQDLVTLSSELRNTLLGAFQELLQDRQALQELEDTLEQALDTGLLPQLEGPGGFVLSTLQDSKGNLSCSRGRAMFYILGALAALNGPHHCLLAQSIEREILSEELELVASILEHNCDRMEETNYPLPKGIFCPLKCEDVVLILNLVQCCGLELDESGCHVTWDPTVAPQLSALYGCLTGLKLLADSSTGSSKTVPEEGTPICP